MCIISKFNMVSVSKRTPPSKIQSLNHCPAEWNAQNLHIFPASELDSWRIIAPAVAVGEVYELRIKIHCFPLISLLFNLLHTMQTSLQSCGYLWVTESFCCSGSSSFLIWLIKHLSYTAPQLAWSCWGRQIRPAGHPSVVWVSGCVLG